jgi:hypothetical protein
MDSLLSSTLICGGNELMAHPAQNQIENGVVDLQEMHHTTKKSVFGAIKRMEAHPGKSIFANGWTEIPRFNFFFSGEFRRFHEAQPRNFGTG